MDVKQILFIQGGGDDGYEADQALAAALKKALGKDYTIHYPEMKSDEAAADFGWVKQIGEKIAELKGDLFLVGHSLGASMILKYLSENPVTKKIKAVFLLATPFWSGDEDWKAGLKLQKDFADHLPAETPIFIYHAQDDEEVPFSQFDQYKQELPQATFREIKQGGHQLGNNLTVVAKAISSL